MSYILLAITLITGILQAENLFSKPVNVKSWIIVGLLIISTILSFIIEYRNKKEKKHSSETGVLQSERTKAHGITWALGNNARAYFPDGKFQMSGLSRWMVSHDKENTASILKAFEGVQLEAHLENNKIIVNTTIRDVQGNIVAEIINNNWKVNAKPIVWDKNFDDNALEVRNNEGQVVLQIEIIKNTLNLKGIFIKSDGSMVVIRGIKLPQLGPDAETAIIQLGPAGKAAELMKKKEVLYIEPMFKYPSANFPGKRNN